ncbi:MAG: ABC transporter permease [Cetobacterium sp.]|uniref:ABC transporter permease n=1 Tax=Cetobacterium sp. TaxID=2071632 RepID=UPI003F2B55CD
MKNKTILLCSLILIFFFTIGLFANIIAPHDPYLIDIEKKFLKASLIYPFGTDHLGRCFFSRIVYGLRSTILTSFIVSIISMFLGLIIGIGTGFSNKWIDMIITKFIDIFNSFPRIIFILIVISTFKASSFSLGLAIILTKWILYAKISRNLTKVIKEKEFILSSNLLGTNKFKIILFQILPNILPQIISIFTIDFGNVILSLAGYSFLGFGAKPPNAELGMMLNEGRTYIYNNPNLIFWPGLIISCFVLNLNILGDKLNEKIESLKE